MNRYRSGETDEFEPGSTGSVLRNHLGIIDPEMAGFAETRLLARAQFWGYARFSPKTRFSVDVLRQMHKQWLQELYPFAGEIRRVDLSKGGLLFAPIVHMHDSLRQLDECLARETPCLDKEREELIASIARVHAELVLVHPFREGMGGYLAG